MLWLLEFNKADGPFYSIIFIAKERANLFPPFLPTIHINMYSAYPFFLLSCTHTPCFCFFFAFCCHWLQPLMKTEHTWAPFTARKWTWETQRGCIAGFKRGEKAWTFSASLTAGITLFSLTVKPSHGADSWGLGGERREKSWSTCTVALRGLAKSELCGFLNDTSTSALNTTKHIPPVQPAREDSHLQNWEHKILQWKQGWHLRRIFTPLIEIMWGLSQVLVPDIGCHVMNAPVASTDGCNLERNT